MRGAERAVGHRLSLLLRSERLLRHRVDRHGRLRLPRLELVDDEHDAVHADPVAGKRADVDVLAGCLWRGETQTLGLAFLDQPGRERTAGRSGTKAFASGSVGIGIALPAVPTASSDPGWLTIRLCGIASGLNSTICTGLPASTTNHFRSKLSFSGIVWIRTTCTPRARRSRRMARFGSSGSFAASFSPNWMASNASQDQSADLPECPPRWRRWRAPAVRLPRQARHSRGCAAARRPRRAGAGSASGFTSFARRSKVAASRRIQPSASRAAVSNGRSLVCRAGVARREELIAQGSPSRAAAAGR